MAKDERLTGSNTSFYYQFYQNMFEMADLTSFAWQPMLKAIGRTHLEFAGLQARQTRAMVHWAHQLTRPASPADVYNANVQLWATMMQDYLDAAPRVAAAVETATEAVVSPAILEMPPKPAHDTLILLDRDEAGVPRRKDGREEQRGDERRKVA